MKVLILCGGKGLRLRPITENIPKPLVTLRGKPLLDHIIEFFAKSGFPDVVLAIGYKGEMIRSYYSGRKIEYVDSGDAGILQRIKDANGLLSDRFFVAYGDAIADVDLRKLIDAHTRNNALVTITTYRMQSPFGIVESDSTGKIVDFREKPFLDHWINIGFMVFEKRALEYAGTDLVEFFEKIISLGRLYEYRHHGKHITVNTEKDKENAEKEIGYFHTYVGGSE